MLDNWEAMSSDLRDLSVVLLFSKLYNGNEEETLQKCFDLMKKIRDYEFKKEAGV